MKPEEIKLGDWIRILAGHVPPEFYIELVIRVFFVYLLLTVSIRLLGKRMTSQVSRVDMAAVVALASAVGVPVLAPDRGLVPAVIIAAIVVLVNRFIAQKSFRNKKFEKLTQGDVAVLVEDGAMKYKKMKAVRVTRERLLAQLRSEKIYQLGSVKRLYIEADGNFTLIKSKNEKAGLPVLPDWDRPYTEEMLKSTETEICSRCGVEKQQNLKTEKDKVSCSNCGYSQWTNAMISKNAG